MARTDIRIAVAMSALLVVASACGRGGATGSATPSPPGPVTVAPGTSDPSPSVSAGQPTATTATPPPATSATSAQEAAGHCHARGSGLYVLPDPSCTPGAASPAVTQDDIGQTICKPGWTATVRPPESYTEPLKYQQMAAYGDTGSAGNYEEDHLISLELGGSPTSRENLWPEPGASPNPKDSVENAAKRAVCAGRMTLAAAQQAIAANWITLGRQLGVTQPQIPTTQAPPGQAASCTVAAAYNSKYGDWDIYVNSNQPGQTVEVRTSGGETASYHTNSSGYADVYLHAASSATGQRVTVTVGGATCATTL